MEPLLKAAPTPEVTVALLRNPLTRGAVRAAAFHHLRPLHRARLRRYGVEVAKDRIAGVRVKRVRKTGAVSDGRLLLNFHGGGLIVDAGSLTETIPIAGMTGVEVVSVLYRMAPEYVFPAAVDDALAVYRQALAERPPHSIGIYGTSAGAILTMQLLARINAEGLPMPAAAGCFSGGGDLSLVTDCETFLPPILGNRSAADTLAEYAGATPRTDPLLSPMKGDLSGLPPVMLMTSTRDQLLSHTVLLDRALRRAGVQTELQVYEGLFHAFWGWIDCPESDEALEQQAAFLSRHVTA